MDTNTNKLVSITDINLDFSKVASMADENGSVVVLKDNKPRYLILNLDYDNNVQILPDEEIMDFSDQLIEQNKEAYEELAK